jgi:arabinogalactan oligomer/maltooligosaccharide transport system substrate-binding protein
MQALANKWAAANGDTVKFLNTSQPGMGGGSTDVAGLLRLKAKSSSAADLAYSTEDQAGSLVLSGILAPRPAGLLSAADQAKYRPNALGASLVNGVGYSIPQAVDGTFLYYNKKYVSAPPGTWTALINTARSAQTKGAKYGFLWYITGGIYYSYWAFNAYGGYVFGTKNGKFDTTDIGLANAGSVQAVTFLKSLTSIVPPTTDYNAADSNFSAGKAAMTINGPWALDAYQKALGSNLGAAPIPWLNGKAGAPFIGVRVWEVNNFSKNKAAAWDLAKYLSMNGQAISGNFEGRLPAFKSVSGWTASPIQIAAAKAFSIGVPMPNIPEMSTVWTPINNAITLAVQGKASPQTALTSAVAQIRAAIAKQHTS